MVTEVLRAFLAARSVRNECVKSAHEHHHAKTCAESSVSFYKVGISALLHTDIGLSALSVKSILKGLPNKRIAGDPSIRRTFADDEIQAMCQACQTDAKWILFLRIPSEIGLRISCICNLQYHMLLDSTHTPRVVCRVPEKGRSWRSFVTSLRLKQAIKRYAEGLRDQGLVPAGCDMYLLDPTSPSKPVIPETVGRGLKAIPKKAGVTEINVHAHCFATPLLVSL